MILAVDGNFYLHRVFHVNARARVGGGSIANNFLSLVCKDAYLAKCKKVIVAFDGDDLERSKVSSYKSARKDSKDNDGKDSPYIHLHSVIKILESAGVPWIQLPKYEADDILCSIACNNKNVFVATRDKDAYQYILRGDIKMFDSTNKSKGGTYTPKITSRADIEKDTGMKPEIWLDYQTLVGDKVDSIQNLMKPSKAKASLIKFGSIKMWGRKDKEFREWLKASLNEVTENRFLVKLKTDIKIDLPDILWSKNQNLPKTYFTLQDFVNPKSKGLF